MKLRRGMTVLELMIVLAIIGGAAILVRSGFRLISKADLVENSTELAAILRRTQQLAVELGEMHRVLIDLDHGIYAVEVCQGATAIQRNERLNPDEEQVKRAKERGEQKLINMPKEALGMDPEEAAKKATSIAGHHVADRMCGPASTSIMSGIVEEYRKNDTRNLKDKTWVRELRSEKGIKFKEVWVQHRDDSVTKGQIAIYFFPVGSAEKAVIELTDGDETFSVLVHGLTGRVQLKDGVLDDINDHMLRNALGDKDARREDTP